MSAKLRGRWTSLKKERGRRTWDLVTICKLTRTYQSKWKFNRDYPGAYAWLVRHEMMWLAFAHAPWVTV